MGGGVSVRAGSAPDVDALAMPCQPVHQESRLLMVLKKTSVKNARASKESAEGEVFLMGVRGQAGAPGWLW